jgi:hypothetical protein
MQRANVGAVEDDPLLELLDEARAQEAGRRRSRERALRRQAEEDASLAGSMLDLAERGRRLALRTSDGRSHTGSLVALGADFAVVRTGAGVDVLVALGSVASVRPGPAPAATGDRPTPSRTRLLDVLSVAAEDRPRVSLVVAGEAVAGELRAAGADVVTVLLDGPERVPAYVAAAAISEVVLQR